MLNFRSGGVEARWKKVDGAGRAMAARMNCDRRVRVGARVRLLPRAPLSSVRHGSRIDKPSREPRRPPSPASGRRDRGTKPLRIVEFTERSQKGQVNARFRSGGRVPSLAGEGATPQTRSVSGVAVKSKKMEGAGRAMAARMNCDRRVRVGARVRLLPRAPLSSVRHGSRVAAIARTAPSTFSRQR